MHAPPRGEARAASERSTVRWLLSGQLLMFTGIAAVFPIAPLYVRDHGGGAVAAALFIAGALVANALVQIPAGRLVDRIGRRRVLLGSRAAYALLAFAIFGLDAAPLWVLATLRTGMGLAAGAYIPALLATLTDLSTDDRRAERFSQLQAAELAGLLVGPLVGGVVALWSTAAVFLVTGAAVGLGVIAQTNVPETHVRVDRSGTRRGAPPLPNGWWRVRGLLVPAAALAALGATFSMYDVVWPQYLSARGASTVVVGVSISLFALPMLLLARPGGRLADRSDRRVVLAACFVSVAACCATYPLLRSIPIAVAIGAVEAVALVMCEPSLYATVGDAAHRDGRGRAMGIGSSAQLGGAGLGSGALGSLYGVGEGLPFWAASGLLIAAAALCAAALPPGHRGRRVTPGSSAAAAGPEAGALVLEALEHRQHPRGADVDWPMLTGQLDEVDALLADGESGDGVRDAHRDENVAAVGESE